jgi:hypothetical protein
MDDFLGRAVPSPILDNEASGSKAGTATIGLACLNWIKAAAARSRGAPVKRYARLAALTACLFGLTCLGLPNIQRPGRTLPSAEINSPAQKTTKESQAQRVEAEAIRAAQSPNTEEVSAPQTAKPGLEAAKDETGPGNVEAAGKTSRLPPKPVGKLANGGERLDLIGVKVTALLAVDPVLDHSVSASPARRRQRARHDAFDPSRHPNAPGAPRPLGIIREYASGERAN